MLSVVFAWGIHGMHGPVIKQDRSPHSPLRLYPVGLSTDRLVEIQQTQCTQPSLSAHPPTGLQAPRLLQSMHETPVTSAWCVTCAVPKLWVVPRVVAGGNTCKHEGRRQTSAAVQAHGEAGKQAGERDAAL